MMKRIAGHLFLFTCFSTTAFFQTDVKSAVMSSYDISSPPVLEIKWADGHNLAYCKIGADGWFAAPQRIPNWKQTAEFPSPSAVQYSSRMEDDDFKVRISVLMGVHHDREILVGEYVVRFNERTVINELKKFGIVPFEITLVRAPANTAELPNIINKTTSLQVSVEPFVSNLPGFKVRLLNNSPKVVTWVTFETSVNGEPRTSTAKRNNERPGLIEPGDSVEYSFPLPLEHNLKSTGETPGVEKNVDLVVTSVAFAGGTYEGDKNRVAEYKSFTLGERLQATRILEVLRSKFESIGQLDKAISAMITTVDEKEFAEMATRYSGLFQSDVNRYRSAVSVSSSAVQKSFVNEFSAKRQISGGSLEALQPWIALSIDRFEKWLDAVSQ